MKRYLARRLLYLLPVLLGISLLAFGLGSLARGDPAALIWYRDNDRPPAAEDLDRVRAENGLDDPLPIRYVRWLGDAARGDLGRSYKSGEAVSQALGQRLQATMQLALGAAIVTLVIALPVGIISAVYRNSLLDHVARVVALAGASLPSFWLGYLLIIAFSVKLGLLPVAGQGGIKHLILPSITLGAASTAILMRLMRSALLEVIGEDYIRTAKAKGLALRTVVGRHALKNAMIPVVTVMGMVFGHLLAGAVIVETVFAWPGVGKLAVDAIFNRDYPVIQGFVLLMGAIFVAVNLMVDVLYVWLDPRVRLGRPVGAHGTP